MTYSTSPELEAILAGLPRPHADLLLHLDGHPEFSVRPYRVMQVGIFYHDQKVGGFNRKERHWYLSQVFAATDEQRAVAGRYLDLREHPPGHFHWIAKGVGATARFEAVLAILAGQEIR